MMVDNVCMYCVHFNDDPKDPAAEPTCTAYPGGIPDSIWYDGVDHRVPHPGDNGITFSPVEGTPPEYLEAVEQ